MNRKENVDQNENNGLFYDIFQLLFALLGVFLFLSLFSYSKNDPSYSTIVFSTYEDSVKNLFGKTGAYMASVLGMTFGWVCLLFPFIFVYICILFYRVKKELSSKFAPIVGFIYGLCIIFSLSIISGLVADHDFYFTGQAGGAMGAIGASLIASIIGKVGGVVVFVFLIIIFAMLLFSVTFADIGQIFILIKERLAIRKKHKTNEFIIRKTEIDTPKENPVKRFFIALKNKLSSLFEKKEKEEKCIEENIEPTKINREELNDAPLFKPAYVPDKDDYIEEKPVEEPVVIKPITQEKAQEILEETPTFEAYSEPVLSEPVLCETKKVKTSTFISYSVPLSLLSDASNEVVHESRDELKAKSDLLIQKLNDFGITGQVRAIQPGPVVTMFEFEPASGIRINKIATLDNDLALNMSALSIRIIAPIPGKNAIGIEIPNKNREGVFIKELLQTKEFSASTSPLSIVLGKDTEGKPYMADVCKMPHLLVAGTTGSGKSVGINTMICSILYKSSPDKVKFIMIDPKMVELSVYEGIPHLLAPVVTDPKLAASVLKNVVAEMTRRYTLLSERKVRNIEGYNDSVKNDGSADEMSYLVVIVDEFADLMMVAGKDVEISIARIAQMARAVGIHLIIATQRPTANVITGLIKSNMPARLSFKVSQKNDSRVILDQNGADTLLGQGDSLFIRPGTSEPIRIHGAFVSDREVRDIVEFLQNKYGEPEYDMTLVQEVKENSSASTSDEDRDERYEEVLNLAYEKGEVSISAIQRRLKIGYNRAARIMEQMEREGIVAPSDGTSKPRKVLEKR